MKHIKLLAVIAAMTICGTISAQQTFFKVSYSNAAIEMKSGRLPVTENMNGLSIGVSQARPLLGELPFFYEYGVDAMAVFGDHNSTLVSAIVPVSLMYQLDLGQIQLLPFAGLNLTAHILGQSKYEGVTSDWFKSDNGKSADNRFQLCAQLGVKAVYNRYFLEFAYHPSLTNLADRTSLNLINVSFGFMF